MGESLICPTETNKQGDVKRSNDNNNNQRNKPSPVFNNIGNNGHIRLESLNTNSSDIQRVKTNGDFLEHVIDPELTFGFTFRKIGAGLENLGNTCFLNSVLQCLTYTEPFAAYMQSGKHNISSDKIIEMFIPIGLYFVSTVIWSRCWVLCNVCDSKSCQVCSAVNRRILAPKDLVKNLRLDIAMVFLNNVHLTRGVMGSFYQAYLGTSEMLDRRMHMSTWLACWNQCTNAAYLQDFQAESPSAYDKSLVHKIFGGRLRSQVKCTECLNGSNKYDPFLDLSLEIAKADSLHKALMHFTALEHLDGGEREYQCQRCKQKVRAVKQLTINKAPYVLTIHLKRFGSLIFGQKIDKKVEFRTTLDLKPFYSGNYVMLNDLEDVSGSSDQDVQSSLLSKMPCYGYISISILYFLCRRDFISPAGRRSEVHPLWSSSSCWLQYPFRSLLLFPFATPTGAGMLLMTTRSSKLVKRLCWSRRLICCFYVQNRKSLAPKKPVNAVRKENSLVKYVEHKGHSLSIMGFKETIRNDTLTKGSSAPVFPSILTNIDALTSDSRKESGLKNSSVFTTKGQLTEGAALSTVLEPYWMKLLKELTIISVQHSNDNLISAEGLLKTASSVVEVGGTVSDPMDVATGAKCEAVHELKESKKDLNVQVATLPDSSISQESSATDMEQEVTKEDLTVPVGTLPNCTVFPELVSKKSPIDLEPGVNEKKEKDLSVQIATLPDCSVSQETSAIVMKQEVTKKDLTVPVAILPNCTVLPEFVAKKSPIDLEPGVNVKDLTVQVVTLPDCNFSKETSATDMERELSMTGLTVPVATLPDCNISQYTLATDMEHEVTKTGLTVPVATLPDCNGFQEFSFKKSATDMEHVVNKKDLTLPVSPLPECSVSPEFASNSPATNMEHEASKKYSAAPVATVPDCNVSQEISCTTSVTNMKQESTSVTKVVPSEALSKRASESRPEELDPMRLSCQTGTEETVWMMVSDIGPEAKHLVQSPSRSVTEEGLCMSACDIGPVEVDSILLSSQLTMEESCKRVSDLGPGEVGSMLPSSQSGTEVALCKGVSDSGPGEGALDLVNQLSTEEAVCKSSDFVLGKVGSMPLSSQHGTEDGQIGGSLKGRSSSEQKDSEYSCPRYEEFQNVDTSSEIIRCDEKEAIDHVHHHIVLKPRKDLMKFQVSSMHLRSSLLFRASISLRRRRKHRRNRKRGLECGKLTEEELSEDPISGLKASSSQKTRMVAFDSHISQGLLEKFVANDTHCTLAARDSCGESQTNMEEEFTERSRHNGAVLGSSESPVKTSSSALTSNQFRIKESDSSESKKSSIHDMMSMLTRGLEESTEFRSTMNCPLIHYQMHICCAVGSEMESQPSEIIGVSKAQSISIGYVADKWDEEYDCGKRKRVGSSKKGSGGSNPFQKIVTMKSQVKKAKMDQTRSGNRPFRI
ncbi:hypothetical protein IFM89_003164 [Coptis chinensis]|uniref:USP domain-containing protein n=1 Tax=Coptis chinensis TaxID=261450 RepID=A0A835I8S9_9MAGN|nr:hypothetical protein IFM89_003164 [Coptis chinensis]